MRLLLLLLRHLELLLHRSHTLLSLPGIRSLRLHTDATARKVAAYFGVPVDCLTRETDDPAPEQKEKAPQSDVDRLMEGLNAESIRKLREYAELLLLGQEKEEKKP